MNKKELIDKIAKEAGISKAQAKLAVDAMVKAIQESLKKREPVNLVGLGTFLVKHRPARAGRNPQTGEVIHLSASETPSFKAGKALKETIYEGPTGGGGPGKKGD
ncbi:HU family DNA-binding protein [Stutzerimonas xanthomarina]|uniref:HU family DNA-binding protein n=1 Tax=Stutzerimonas xanthomarina TaxID=271420 RepID=UPI0029B12FD5|nr:HU family DNA-binding protein [Stutzerimonas xanthomarina]MDX2355216.1 HU family DNA-binding protein [Stutzerimonas xanthomarina]